MELRNGFRLHSRHSQGSDLWLARSDSGSQSTGVTKRSEKILNQMGDSKSATEEKGSVRVWPPEKEELENLYLTQRLSAMKVSRLYGLKYPNPKSGESMVLWYLKKFGIKRRDKAEHIRKVTEEMVEQWISRYRKGESLKTDRWRRVQPSYSFPPPSEARHYSAREGRGSNQGRNEICKIPIFWRAC